MSALPTFTAEVVTAYHGMCEQESPNDYFVAGFADGNSLSMSLDSTGKGGMQKVVEILTKKYESEIAVAMFRVTAVDNRGSTTSFRTKLIHVIFVGPKCPVMKRARVAGFNSAFKQPFTSNLAIQTDNAEADLTVASIERSLRASGGAHQPTSFDFENKADGKKPEATFVVAEDGLPTTTGGGHEPKKQEEEMIDTLNDEIKQLDGILETVTNDLRALTTEISQKEEKETAERGENAGNSFVKEKFLSHCNLLKRFQLQPTVDQYASDAIIVRNMMLFNEKGQLIGAEAKRTFKGKEEIAAYHEELFSTLKSDYSVEDGEEDEQQEAESQEPQKESWDLNQSEAVVDEDVRMVTHEWFSPTFFFSSETLFYDKEGRIEKQIISQGTFALPDMNEHDMDAQLQQLLMSGGLQQLFQQMGGGGFDFAPPGGEGDEYLEEVDGMAPDPFEQGVGVSIEEIADEGAAAAAMMNAQGVTIIELDEEDEEKNPQD